MPIQSQHDLSQRLSSWCQRPLGRLLAVVEKNKLKQVLHDIRGAHILQLGMTNQSRWLKASPIRHRVVLSPQTKAVASISVVCGAPAELPFLNDSLDAVVLAHALEFAGDPQPVLQEVWRVLAGEGQVIILGFNPLSLWGLCHFFRSKDAGPPPWQGRSIGMQRLRHYLAQADFEITEQKTFYFRPPVSKKALGARLRFLEFLGAIFFPYLGGVYLFVAKKRVLSVTPIKPVWRVSRELVEKSIAEPTAHGLKLEGLKREGLKRE